MIFRSFRKFFLWIKHLYDKYKIPFYSITKYVLLTIFLLAIVSSLLTFIWYYPEFATEENLSQMTMKERIDFVNDSRKTAAQIVGGLILLVGIYLTFRRVSAVEKNVRVTEEGQITERFTRAIEHLGSDKIEIRLGGIYALERIAKDSEKDHWTIMEVLTVYVRENSGLLTATGQKRKILKPVTLDVQAILTIIGRRQIIYDPEREFIDLFSTNLQSAILVGANLQGANLEGANLQEAFLSNANLQEATLEEANLKEADLMSTNFKGAILWEANLYHANMFATNLQGAALEGANLQQAFLVGANLKGINEITLEQLSQVKSLYKTKLDDEIKKQIEKKYPHLLENPFKKNNE